MNPHRTDRPIVATRDMVRRKRRRRALAVLALLVMALVAVAWGTWRYIDAQEFLLDPRCEVQMGDERHSLSPEQAANAALISAVAVDRGLPQEAAADALAIALQESDLEVLEATPEHDARELFRRGSPDWTDDGTPAEVATTVEEFFDSLESAQDEEENPWTPELSLTDVVEVLDRPMDPSFYPRHAERARAFATPLTGQQPVDMTCHLTRKNAPAADPDGLAQEIALRLEDALQVPEEAQDALEARHAEEDGTDQDGEDALLEEYGPILIDRTGAAGEEAPGRGPDRGAVVTVTMPGAEEDGEHPRPSTQQLWAVAHWAVATADVYGTQTVQAGAHQWSRDTGRWTRADDVDDEAVTIGF
ncbi:hypothetical protein [Nesterenkonia suensis]